jgi:hypothetical protein
MVSACTAGELNGFPGCAVFLHFHSLGNALSWISGSLIFWQRRREISGCELFLAAQPCLAGVRKKSEAHSAAIHSKVSLKAQPEFKAVLEALPSHGPMTSIVVTLSP